MVVNDFDTTDCANGVLFSAAGLFTAGPHVEHSVVGGFGHCAIELEEERHELVARSTLCEAGVGGGVGMEPCLQNR